MTRVPAMLVWGAELPASACPGWTPWLHPPPLILPVSQQGKHQENATCGRAHRAVPSGTPFLYRLRGNSPSFHTLSSLLVYHVSPGEKKSAFDCGFLCGRASSAEWIAASPVAFAPPRPTGRMG